VADVRGGDARAREALERELAPLVRVVARRRQRQSESSSGSAGLPLPAPNVDTLTRRLCRRLLLALRGETVARRLTDTLPAAKRG
jgi:hypothetical protein